MATQTSLRAARVGVAITIILALTIARESRAQTVIVPSGGLTATGLGGDSEWRAGVMNGAQSVIYMGQPERRDTQLDAASRWGAFELALKVAGIAGHPYGTLDFRYQVLNSKKSGLDFTFDVFSGTPSWSSTMLGVGTTIGRDSRFVGAALGAQGGVAASPSPNQRPFGASALLSLTAGTWVHVLPFLDLNVEGATSPHLSSLFGGFTFNAAGLGLPPDSLLRGLRASAFLPLNLIEVPSYTWDHPDGSERRQPGVHELHVLTPAFRISFGTRFE